METKELLENEMAQAVIDLIKSEITEAELVEKLEDYHENDIAEAYENLDPEERQRLFDILGAEKISEIFPYIEDVGDYLSEIEPEQAADVLENMDADDAVDALEDIDDEKQREQLINLMENEASADVLLISSYEDDEIGSMMTTNFIAISKDSSIKQAMRSLISQSEDNDNINTIYVYDENEKYYGAIDLRDLIRARADRPLEDIISHSYPSVLATEKITDTIEMLKDYAEDSIPVLNPFNEILGIITSIDIIEAVDDEMGDDYAKLAGMTAESDLDERLLESVKKRIPWLVMLLALSMITSSAVGLFDTVINEVAILVLFQSVILGMSGNVGTQSLAVTIRVLMDEDVSGKEKAKFAFKEMGLGATIGAILGVLALFFIGGYLHLIKAYAWGASLYISGIVGISLLAAMTMSSFIGTIIPMFFHKIKVDPAVASGPLITTCSDLIGVLTYYGLAGILLLGHI